MRAMQGIESPARPYELPLRTPQTGPRALPARHGLRGLRVPTVSLVAELDIRVGSRKAGHRPRHRTHTKRAGSVIWVIVLGAVAWLSGVVVMFCICVVAARADRHAEGHERGYPSASDDR